MHFIVERILRSDSVKDMKGIGVDVEGRAGGELAER